VGALIGVIADPKENIEAMLKEAPGDGGAPSTSPPRRPAPPCSSPGAARACWSGAA